MLVPHSYWVVKNAELTSAFKLLVTKYRHPVLTGGVKEIVYSTIRDIFMEKGLVSLVNIVKTKTSRFARKEYGKTVLKKYYWKPYFWSDSYFVTTVSENSLAVVQEYIRNQ